MVHEVRHGVEGEDDCGEEDTTESSRVSVSCNDDEGQTRIIYRMVIVEGCCTMARLSSLGANCSLVDTKV